MTMRRIAEASVWALAVGAVVGSVTAWTRAIPDARVEPRLVPWLPGEPRRIEIQEIRGAATTLRDRNPFRIERAPTSLRFGSPPAVPEPVAAESQLPNLALAGIVGGPPWLALVEGIPGREIGAILVEGAELNGIRLERLRGDTAVLSGLDTTWVLLPKRAWR